MARRRVRAFVPLRRQRARRGRHVFEQQDDLSQRDHRRGTASRRTSRCPSAAPGLVEIWPLIEPDEKREIEAWDAPFDDLRRRARACSWRSARSRATVARRWQPKRGDARRATFWCWCASAGRCSRRSSARSRTTDIEVAGADRLVLTEHIAVMDLMALADALLLPRGRSRARDRAQEPAVRSDEDDLFALAWERKGRCARPCAPRRRTRALRRPRRARPLSRAGAARYAVRLLCACCSAPSAAASASSRGSGTRPTTCSTNSSISRSTTRRRETPSLQGFVAWLRTAQGRDQARHGDRRATRCG